MISRIDASRRACLLALALAGGLAGCGDPAAVIEGRERVDFDREVDTKWKQNWMWVEGVQFFEKGGVYVDSGESSDATYDKPKVLPLLKRLSSKHGLKWQAVVDKKQRNIAVAVLGSYPDQAGVQNAVMETLSEEQKNFPLDILVQTGNRWMSLDFLTADESNFLEGGPAK